MSEPGQQVRPETAALTKDDYEPQGTVEEMGIPQPDGAGGLVLPPAPADEGSQDEEVKEVEGRREFPNPETVGESSRTEKPPDWTPRGSRQHDLLPEIGRLAREIVRNGEEKVAVAVGAYNSVRLAFRSSSSADRDRLTGIFELLTQHYLRKKRRYCSACDQQLCRRAGWMIR